MKRIGLVVLILVWSGIVQAAPHDITWTEGPENPVLSQTTVGAGRFYYAHVLYDAFAGKYRAWADASSSNDITYAESVGNSPASWTNYTLCNVTPSARGKAHVVQLGANSFRMWHTGEDGTPGYEVYTYTGSDGINWSEGILITGVADSIGIEGAADSTPYADGPMEQFAPAAGGPGFYCLSNTREGGAGQTERQINLYSSVDGITWTFVRSTEIFGWDVSTLVIHPDRPNTWYAYLYTADTQIASMQTTDGGMTWEIDEEPVPVIGLAGEFPYNPSRNYNPSAIYRGSGNWVMFRTTSNSEATPVHTTSYATGVEANLPSAVESWSQY